MQWLKKVIINLFVLIKNREQEIPNQNTFTWREFEFPFPRFISVDLLVALPKDCADLYRTGQRRDGVFTIDPDGAGAFEVFCDQTNNGGGWIVFQRKRRGSYSFSKDWNDYKNGFGNQSKDFWLGLDKLHRLTISSHHQLRICGRHCDTQCKLYKSFKIQSEETTISWKWVN